MENNQLYPFESNRYYAGKMLTSSDFRAEQTYFNNKRRFINSLVYGSGIICGCNVFSLDDLSVLVESGAAIDDYGREILIQSSAVKKLSAIEGFQEIEGNEVLLCVRYRETPVHSVFAVNREGQEDSYEYNRISEGYELFLKDASEAGAGFELENDFFMVNRLYEDKDYCIEITMPVTVCKGAFARIHAVLKKLSDDTAPVSWKGAIQMPAFEAEDGAHELGMDFTDVVLLKGQTVSKDYWVEAKETEEEETNLVFQDERGNHSFKIRMRDADPDALVTEEIGKTSLEMLNLEEKKEQVLKSIEEQGKLTEELQAKIVAAETMVVVEDLYRPYRPKRKTRASVAKEKGLDGLAQFILAQETTAPIEEEAAKYVHEDEDAARTVATVGDAIQGAKDIIAEMISDEADYRIYIRNITTEEGKLTSVAKDEKAESVYEMYYQNDLSLTEIGEELLISRQAVRDQLKRTEKILQQYESKLQLVQKFLKQKMAVQKIKSIIEEIEKEEHLSDKAKYNIETIQKIAAEILA